MTASQSRCASNLRFIGLSDACEARLLVDDNAAVRSFVRKLFESQSDFEISGEAENGRDAVEKAEKLKPDLIILDLIMPVMTGFEAAPLIKQLLPDTLIILFTQQEGSEIQRLAKASGIDAVITKGQVASELLLQAKALLASTGQEHDPAKFRDAVRTPTCASLHLKIPNLAREKRGKRYKLRPWQHVVRRLDSSFSVLSTHASAWPHPSPCSQKRPKLADQSPRTRPASVR